jgi:hypothetical protein
MLKEVQRIYVAPVPGRWMLRACGTMEMIIRESIRRGSTMLPRASPLNILTGIEHSVTKERAGFNSHWTLIAGL